MPLFRTKDDKHRETCYPYMLNHIKEAEAECKTLRSRIEEQEASVKANREMYKIAENVVREQAAEISRLNTEVDRLRALVCDKLTEESQKLGEYDLPYGSAFIG